MLENNVYHSILTNAPVGYAYHRLIPDEDNNFLDYEFIEVNPAFEELTGLRGVDIIGKRASEIFAAGSHDWQINVSKYYQKVAMNGGALEFEHHDEKLNIHLLIKVFSTQKNYFAICASDISQVCWQAYDSLRESEARFRSYIDNAPVGIFVANEKGEYIEVNRAACQLTGYSEEELIQMNILDFSTEETRAEYNGHFSELIHNNKANPIELPFRCKNGLTRHWSKTVVKLSDKRYLGFAKDITQRKLMEQKLMESEARFRLLYDRAPLGYQSLNAKGNLTMVNQTWLDTLGYKRKEVIGHNLSDFIHSDNRGDFQKNFSLFKSKREFRMEYELRKKDGSYILASFFGKVSYDEQGNFKQTHCIFHDITSLRNAEKKIKNYTKELELKNSELEVVYNRLNEEISKAVVLHRQFLPKSLPSTDWLTAVANYQPAEYIGGDFYNVYEIGERVLFFLADVSGHGIDGAMLSIFIRENITSFIIAEKNIANIQPETVINFIAERYWQENFSDEYFICLLVGIIDPNEKTVTVANAGIQIYPMIVNTVGEIGEIEAEGLPISKAIDQSLYQYQARSLAYQPGDIIFVTTDGLIEAEKDGMKYGIDNVKKVILDSRRLPPAVIRDNIKQDLIKFSGVEQGQDDITYLIIELNKSFD